MDRDRGIKREYLRMKIRIGKIVHVNAPAFWIDDPVFADAGMLVLGQFQNHVPGTGRRGNDLNNKIRSPGDAAGFEIVGTTQYKEIRLQHGSVIVVELHVAWREKYFAAVLMGSSA